MKRNIIGFILAFFIVVSIANVSAFFPVTHKYLENELMNTYSGNSEFYQTCLEYPDLCYVGNVLTDLSVVYYFVEGGVKYEVTHSPGFCLGNLNNVKSYEGVTIEESRACAIGSCLHASQDLVSHKEMVPYAIRHTGMANTVIHVFAEQKLDNFVLKNNPDIGNEVLTLGDESWEKCIPLFKETLGGYAEYDTEFNEGKLDDVINTFIGEVRKSIDVGSTGYDVSFNNKVSVFGKIGLIPFPFLVAYLGSMFLFLLLSILLIFKKNKKILNWISIGIFSIIFILQLILFVSALNGNAFTTMVTYIKPFSNLVPLGGSQSYIDQSIQNGVSFFNEGEPWMEGKMASGFDELKAADARVMMFDYILIGIIILALGLLIYFNFKKKHVKEAFEW